MKLKYITPLLFLTYTASAQLTVTPGAGFFINGDIPLTLKNTDLVNNGIFAGGVNTISFTGDASSSISGSGALRFFILEVNKNNGQSVILEKSIDVVNSVLFTSGFFDLNGFNVDLETTGRIDGENNNRRFLGANGGQILLNTTLNAPSNVNPGNLGVQLTSDQNLGQVVIKRGHQSQVGTGLSSSIFRYYEISSANNNNLNTTLRFNYFDEELNAFNENSLVLFKSDDAINWLTQGFTTRNTTDNFVEKTGIGSFSRFTLSGGVDAPLPVHFISFNVKCEGNKVAITWKTAQEQNSSRFDIERSVDGSQWRAIGTVPASGNSNSEKTYSFTDNNPDPNNYYRIALYDLNGRVQYTSILRSSCSTITDMLTLFPNPFQSTFFINITSAISSQAVIRIFDSKGTLVKKQVATIFQGTNQINIDLRSQPGGVYLLSADWNNGQTKKTIQIIKR
jgi:hypothetical protein